MHLNIHLERLTVYLQNDEEKRVLIAFLKSLDYKYQVEPDLLPAAIIQELHNRKADFIAGKTSSRPWNDIKLSYDKS
jgi:hypothetical protein